MPLCETQATTFLGLQNPAQIPRFSITCSAITVGNFFGFILAARETPREFERGYFVPCLYVVLDIHLQRRVWPLRGK